MPEADIQSDFTKLRTEKWKIASPIDDGYNCIAFAVHDTHQFWDPSVVGVRGYYWPPGIPRDWRVTTLMKLYELHGFKRCDSLALEKGFEKLVIYSTSSDSGTHAARQKESGAWLSKLGPCEDIEHESPAGLEGVIYGSVTVVMKRKLTSPRESSLSILSLVRMFGHDCGDYNMRKINSERESTEFKNFREFTRKILAVPKKEIDKQKAAYEKKKSKKGKPAK